MTVWAIQHSPGLKQSDSTLQPFTPSQSKVSTSHTSAWFITLALQHNPISHIKCSLSSVGVVEIGVKMPKSNYHGPCMNPIGMDRGVVFSPYPVSLSHTNKLHNHMRMPCMVHVTRQRGCKLITVVQGMGAGVHALTALQVEERDAACWLGNKQQARACMRCSGRCETHKSGPIHPMWHVSIKVIQCGT